MVAQAVLSLFLLLSKHYMLAALHVAFDMYLGHLLMEKRLSVDATDAFKQLPAQKRQRTIQLAFHVLSFMVVVYKWGAALGLCRQLLWRWGVRSRRAAARRVLGVRPGAQRAR